MKKCTYCQEMLDDDMQFCPNCGAPVPKQEPAAAEPAVQTSAPVFSAAPVTPAAEQKNNGLAITSLVLGIVSVCCCCLNPLTSALAIIFGAIALAQIGKGGTKGKGMAITGLVLGILMLLMCIVSIPFSIDDLAYEFDIDGYDDYGDYNDYYGDHFFDDFDFDDFLGELGEI